MKLLLERVGRDLATPLDNALGRVTQRAGLLLRLEARDGASGRGEASPLPGLSVETLDACGRALAQLAGARLAPLDDGPPLELLERFVLSAGPLPAAARCALETAALDLLGRRRGVAAALLLGAEARARVALGALVTPDARGSLLAGAREAVARGRHTLKIKLGPHGHEDAALAELRRELGPEFTLRLDANRSLDEAGLATRLAALAPLRPQFVEEPSHAAALLRLTHSPVLIALDESLATAAGLPLAEQLASRGILGALVLKPMLLGGALPCLALARRAALLGVPTVVTHLWDGPVGLAAAASLALALAPTSLAAGLEPHPGLAAYPALVGSFLDGASLCVPARPGLGLEEATP